MAKGNLANYAKLEKFLADKDYEYENLTEHQYRILGPVAIVDIWPARMTVHVLQTESVDPNRYFRLNYHFNEDQVEAVLNGEDWRITK